MAKTKRRAAKELQIRHGKWEAEKLLRKADSRLGKILRDQPRKVGGNKPVDPSRLAADYVVLGDYFSEHGDPGLASRSYFGAQRVVDRAGLDGYDDLASKLDAARESSPGVPKGYVAAGASAILGGALLAVGSITGNVVGISEVSYTGAVLFLAGVALLAIGFLKKR